MTVTVHGESDMSRRAGSAAPGTPAAGARGHDAPVGVVRLLGDADVRSLIEAAPLVDLIEAALADFSRGTVVNPARTVLYAGGDTAYVAVMPAFSPAHDSLGAKLVTAFSTNKDRGLPSHFATIVLLDAATGALQGIVDGRYITEMRTAAVSAVACRHLAQHPVRTLAILGAGVQARGHLAVLDATESFQQIRVWSPGGSAAGLASALSPQLKAPLTCAATAERAVRGADVVVLVTDSPDPVVESSWVDPGALVVSVGACRPTHREIDPALLARARLFVDSRVSALHESGDVLLGIAEGRFGPDHILGELGDVVLGRAPARSTAEDVVVFKSLGLAVEDLATAALVYRLAEQRGLGRRVPW